MNVKALQQVMLVDLFFALFCWLFFDLTPAIDPQGRILYARIGMAGLAFPAVLFQTSMVWSPDHGTIVIPVARQVGLVAGLVFLGIFSMLNPPFHSVVAVLFAGTFSGVAVYELSGPEKKA